MYTTLASERECGLTLLDLIDDLVGCLLAKVVDNDIGAVLGIHDGVRATETGTSTGDDDSLAVEANLVGLRVLLDLFGALEQVLCRRPAQTQH